MFQELTAFSRVNVVLHYCCYFQLGFQHVDIVHIDMNYMIFAVNDKILKKTTRFQPRMKKRRLKMEKKYWRKREKSQKSPFSCISTFVLYFKLNECLICCVKQC